MRTTIKVPSVIEFFSTYPSIEMKKNRIIVRVCRYKFYMGNAFLEAGYVYIPYIPLTRINIEFNITSTGIENTNGDTDDY